MWEHPPGGHGGSAEAPGGGLTCRELTASRNILPGITPSDYRHIDYFSQVCHNVSVINGLSISELKRCSMKKFFKWLGIALGIFLLGILLLLAYWYFRPNRAQVNKDIVTETWPIADNNMHNSNTDMIEWNGETYIAYVTSPYHFSSEASTLHIKHSPDHGRTWVEDSSFNPDKNDIRDPKFAVIGKRLFLYALDNNSFNPEPYQTVYSYTEDGKDWSPLKVVPGVDGWLFWRPKTQDGKTFYNSAYWFEHGRAALLKSTDGINWEVVSIINEGERNDETEIIFLPDNRLLATARLEYDESWLEGTLGDKRGSTLITVSTPPYTKWTELAQSKVTRLDGPYLFPYNGRVYAIGRYQPDLGRSGPLTDEGSALAKKRTALFEVREDGLAYLTDLPSDGDTSYVGLVQDSDTAYASYYTSPLNHDYGWIMGMFLPTQVRIAKIDLKAMEALADKTRSK